jgi:hypothetical protein
MDMQRFEALPPPPGVFGSLRAGLDIVSSRVALILAPLLLNVLLWLGPRLSVDGLLKPFFTFMFDQARRGVSATDMELFVRNQTLLMERLQDYNLLSLLAKLMIFPIGVSSLSAQILPVQTPFGTQEVVDVSSAPGMLGLSFILILLGWAGGGLYYRLVSGAISGEKDAGIGPARAVIQTLILSVLWVIGLTVLFVPLFFILFLLALINPLLMNTAVLVIFFLSFWLIVPLFFTPHGIFIRGQNALISVLSSLRMVRLSLPTSGMFVLSIYILSRGLNYLWSVPSSGSWLMLVGFAGHAFITTTLLAASFVYYRDMNDWLQVIHERYQQANQSTVKRT